MATLLVSDSAQVRVFPLAASTLIGRHWTCPVRILDGSCPLYWLEVRWLEGAWGWRTLGADDRTHGGGAALPAGWRSLAVATLRAGRVRLSESTWIELVTADPPRAHLVRLPDGELLDDDEAAAWAELRADIALPLDVEGDGGQAYPDGHVIIRDGKAVRVHASGGVATTVATPIDLSRPGVFADVDLAARTATFANRAGQVTARGECARVLEVYLQARRIDIPAGGWLSATEAHAAYQALGGSPDATLERLSWERCRLRSILSRAGVAGVGALFEVAPGRDARVRVSQTFDR
jgi:hypothetical protein